MMVGDCCGGILRERRLEQGQGPMLRRCCWCCCTLCGEWCVRVEGHVRMEERAMVAHRMGAIKSCKVQDTIVTLPVLSTREEVTMGEE